MENFSDHVRQRELFVSITVRLKSVWRQIIGIKNNEEMRNCECEWEMWKWPMSPSVVKASKTNHNVFITIFTFYPICLLSLANTIIEPSVENGRKSS